MRKIREIIPGCEVVLMTAYAIVEIVEKAKKRDALGVIYKPVDPSRILRFLEKLKQKTSVMIVDDDDDFCEGLASALDHKGYLAKSAFNGSEAIDVVKDKRFDSIIIDMKLPDMNGLEVAEKVRSIDPAIDVALMTGFASMVPLMEERGRDTAQKMFLKPFELMELVSVLNRFRRMRLARIL
jgi:DNA-binding NtrC family response regulator